MEISKNKEDLIRKMGRLYYKKKETIGKENWIKLSVKCIKKIF